METAGEAFIYQLRVVLEDISPLIWRRLPVPDDDSIADLRFILQIAFDWDDRNLHRFFIHGKDYGIYHSGGMSFSDAPSQVKLADFKFRKGEKFLSEYDFSIVGNICSESKPFCALIRRSIIHSARAVGIYQLRLTERRRNLIESRMNLPIS